MAKVDDRTSLGWQLYVLINGGVAWVTFCNPALRMRFVAQSIDYRPSSVRTFARYTTA